MAGEEGNKSSDFYDVLGLKKECTPLEIKNAYKKLAMKWHPDRCCASEAKKKFQAIQQAYSVLSDGNKRFLYDVGVYDSNDDDDQNGMGDFLNEMASIMTTQTNEENARNQSFWDLQRLFEEIFESSDKQKSSIWARALIMGRVSGGTRKQGRNRTKQKRETLVDEWSN